MSAASDPVGHPLLAYRLVPTQPAPAGVPDAGSESCHRAAPDDASFAERRAAYLAHVAASPPPSHLAAAFHELARLAGGGPAHLGVFEAALDYVEARIDCADFVLHAVLRLVLDFGRDPRLPPALLARAETVIRGFKYHPEEPGEDSLCTWTENHQILFASAALVAGERWPDAVFASAGEPGRAVAARARRRVDRWLAMRFRTGFSEWLSHVYYDEDLAALLTLCDFASDPGLRTRAAMVADVALLDLALHSFQGAVASSHGRSYEGPKKRAREENVTDTLRLALGVGCFAGIENLSAPCLALSSYRPPPVLEAIVRDARPEVRIRQRMGIRLDELARWGLDPDRDEDAFELLSLEAYTHPRTIDAFVRLLGRWQWWSNAFFAPFAARRGLLERLHRMRLLPVLARALEWDLARNVRPEVDLLTYRTPDYQLSSAPDWRPGMGGDQHHVWHASLGGDACCFTTHPGPRGARSPGRWTGSATLPRVAQVDNVLVALYRIHRRPALHVANRNTWTHAWLPRDRFDEVREEAGWVFARRGDGYLALRSQQPARWNESPDAGEDRGRELVADGRENVWLCELGRRADGPFHQWVRRIRAAPTRFGRLEVSYESPSRGSIELGWRGPLRHAGREVTLHGFSRYESPWGTAPFPSDTVEMRCAGHTFRLDWSSGARIVS